MTDKDKFSDRVRLGPESCNGWYEETVMRCGSAMTMGTWWLRSESDPRWNAAGRGKVGGFTMGGDAVGVMGLKRQDYGSPPRDLQWGYMKD